MARAPHLLTAAAAFLLAVALLPAPTSQAAAPNLAGGQRAQSHQQQQPTTATPHHLQQQQQKQPQPTQQPPPHRHHAQPAPAAAANDAPKGRQLARDGVGGAPSATSNRSQLDLGSIFNASNRVEPQVSLHFGAWVALSLLAFTCFLVALATYLDLSEASKPPNYAAYSSLVAKSDENDVNETDGELDLETGNGARAPPEARRSQQQQQRQRRSPSLSSSNSSSSIALSSAPILGKARGQVGGRHHHSPAAWFGRSTTANSYYERNLRLSGPTSGPATNHPDERQKQAEEEEELEFSGGGGNSGPRVWDLFTWSLAKQLLLAFSLRHSAALIFQRGPSERPTAAATTVSIVVSSHSSNIARGQRKFANASPSLMRRSRSNTALSGCTGGHRSRLSSLSSINEQKRREAQEELEALAKVVESDIQQASGSGNSSGSDFDAESLTSSAAAASPSPQPQTSHQQHHHQQPIIVGGGATTEANTNSIDSLHGLRFLSMIWIIVIHSYSFALRWLFFAESAQLANLYKTAASQLLANGTFACDSFFFAGGFLLPYLAFPSSSVASQPTTLPQKQNLRQQTTTTTLTSCQQQPTGKQDSSRLLLPQQQNQQVEEPQRRNEFTVRRALANLLHRYIRMMPLMMAIIGLSANLLRYLGEGDAWTGSTIMFDQWCRSNWWTNALFLHNFIKRETMCLSHSWYSAVDLQLFVVGQVILFVLFRSRKLGLLLIAALMLLAQLLTALLTLSYHLPAVPLIATVSEHTMNIYYGAIYIKPYCRASPYLIGMLLAYLMRTTRLGQVRLTKLQCLAGWAASLASLAAILLAMQPAMNGRPPNELESALYSSLSRPLWACATGWMIFASITGHGGPLAALLSAHCFRPLSRLTYPAFLLHPIVMAAFYGSRHESFHFSHYLMLYLILGNIVITYAGAFLLSALFELPLLSAERSIKRAWRQLKLDHQHQQHHLNQQQQA